MDSSRFAIELRRARVPLAWLMFLVLATFITMYIVISNLTFDRPFEDRYKVNVEFDSVKGIFEGTHPVRIAGVQVGVVSSVEIDGDQAVATLSLEDQYAPLYQDAVVRIRPQSPLEDVYVSIDDRGTPEAGMLEEEGEALPVDQTQSQVQISRVFQTFEPEVRKSLTVLLDELAIGLAGQGEDLNQAFVELAPFLKQAQKVSKIAADREKNVRSIVTNFGLLADELANRDEQLNSLVTQGASTLQSLAAVDDSVSNTIAGIPPAMDAIRSSFASLRDAEDELDPALTEFLPAAQKLESGLEGLKKFADNATPALSDLQPSVNALEPMADALRPTAKSLRTSMELLDPQIPRLNEITKSLAACQGTFQPPGTSDPADAIDNPVAKFFQWTPSVAKFGNPFGPFPRSSVANSGAFGVVAGLFEIDHCYDSDPLP